MINDKNDPLLGPMRQLEQALAAGFPGREREWTERVAGTLAALEAGLRRHAGQAGAPDGVFAGVDLRRPTFLRQMNDLRLGLGVLVREVRGLRERVQQAGQAFRPSASVVRDLDRLPRPVARAAVPHFGELRGDVERFLRRVRLHREEETRLLLESVNTDIGAGD
jgi:hypothetical protein